MAAASAPRWARIVATGSYLPEREVTNAELAERMPASAEYLRKMAASTGITRRYWAPEDWAASDLAVLACRQALERAGRKPEEVDLIVLGTDSPDFLTPATSVVVQHKLGAKNAGTFDVGCACASFPTGYAAAAGMMAVNPSLRVVLVVGGILSLVGCWVARTLTPNIIPALVAFVFFITQWPKGHAMLRPRGDRDDSETYEEPR